MSYNIEYISKCINIIPIKNTLKSAGLSTLSKSIFINYLEVIRTVAASIITSANKLGKLFIKYH